MYMYIYIYIYTNTSMLLTSIQESYVYLAHSHANLEQPFPPCRFCWMGTLRVVSLVLQASFKVALSWRRRTRREDPERSMGPYSTCLVLRGTGSLFIPCAFSSLGPTEGIVAFTGPGSLPRSFEQRPCNSMWLNLITNVKFMLGCWYRYAVSS